MFAVYRMSLKKEKNYFTNFPQIVLNFPSSFFVLAHRMFAINYTGCQ